MRILFSFVFIFLTQISIQTQAATLRSFLGPYQAQGRCDFSGLKSRAYITVTKNQKLQIALYGDEASLTTLPLGSGIMKIPGSSRPGDFIQYATKIEGDTLTCLQKYFLKNQVVSVEQTTLAVKGDLLRLTSQTSDDRIVHACTFRRK